ncbi:MAG TPA: GIY-YIG nuclease family protein [Ignavibacteriaceae bacterium]|nr:GIY-YIG nuclease family protein [Ignavibacteriaceae bacterium]
MVHNSGKVKYTKEHRPWIIHYYKSYKTRSEAVRREQFFKSLEGYKWLREMKII